MKHLLLLLLSTLSFSAWGCYDRTLSDAENLTRCTQSAEQGVASAQGTLGAMYYAGKGTVQDYAQAERWFREAAEQGYLLSQQSLARLYALGHGVTKDLKESAKWYRKAAEGGLPSAQGQMAVLLVTGDGVAMDTVEAYKWALIAGESGYQPADELKVNIAKGMTPEQIAQAEGRARAWFEQRRK